MKLSTAICIVSITYTLTVNASNITYHVISLVPNNETLGVIVNDQVYPLTNTNQDSTLLHFGEAPAPNDGDYKYAILEKETNQVLQSENFTRTLNNGTENTPNDYYGVAWNYFNGLSEIPDIFPPLSIIHRIKSRLHIHNEIPTIHLYGDQSHIDKIHRNQTTEIDISLNMTYISPDDVLHFSKITVSVSGHSTRGLPKLSYKLKTPENEYLYGYRQIKLRSMAMDPSCMRDYFYYGITKSVGLASSEFSYARLYINNQAIGFFGVAEAFKQPWVRNEFANGDPNFRHGALYAADLFGGKDLFQHIGDLNDGNKPPPPPSGGMREPFPSPAQLSNLGNNASLYSEGQYKIKEEPSEGLSPNYTRIMDVSKFISEQPSTPLDNDSTVSLWERQISVDSFLRGLALEIVLSNSDGYFTMGNNYLLYDDLVHERLVFSGQDFDLTMGTGMYNPTNLNGGNYTDFPGFYVRPIMPPLMAVPQFKQRFENLLYTITKEIVNPTVLNPMVEALYTMIAQDVAWDQSLPRVGIDVIQDAIGSINTSLSKNAENMFTQVPFKIAVFGPSVSNFKMSLIDWISLRSNNLLSFLNNQDV